MGLAGEEVVMLRLVCVNFGKSDDCLEWVAYTLLAALAFLGVFGVVGAMASLQCVMVVA
jgi:hypothetical protein